MDDKPLGSCSDLGLPNCQDGSSEDFAGAESLGNIIGTIFFFIGVAATLYLIIAGIQYAASAGDPNKTAQAKNSIIYALIGVVLSFSVFAIINYLFGSGEAIQL